jgi:import inner membrane translocase subunit TIM23
MAFTSFLSDRQTGAASTPDIATSSQLFQTTSFTPNDAAQPTTSTPSVGDLPTASSVFASAYDPAKLHPLAELGNGLDYLALEDSKVADLPGGTSALPSRGWTDELCYGTGATYLSGKWTAPKDVEGEETH